MPARGAIVRSLAGRDRDRLYVVLEHAPPRDCLVSDGRTRPVDRPKRKNARHLARIADPAEEIAARLATGSALTDEEIRRAVKLVERGGPGGREEVQHGS